MAERPILFSAPMVRAILAGTKTQTRRVVKPTPQMVTNRTIQPWGGDAAALLGLLTQTGKSCPYGQPGDRLWVKETFQRFTDDGEIMYAADPASFEAMNELKRDECPEARWRPSIFMPRWASRILLEITEVRVERLQDISEADAIAEGCSIECMSPTGDDSGSAIYGPGGYRALWDQINGAGAWAANPWVWTITFKRIQEAAHG